MDRFEKAGKAFESLCRVMATLRGPGGCPWDQKQTLESLKPYLIEEAYETLDAISSETPGEHCEELGDLLLQIVFQAEITQETSFDVEAVIQGIVDKLTRRHPHVFGESEVSSAEEVNQRWEEIKAAERPRDKGLLDGLPRALPGLVRAYRVGEKAAGVGFDWPDKSGPRDKVLEEWEEVHQALADGEPQERVASEMGDLFFALVNYARHLEIDPDDSLRQAIDRFQSRFQYLEGHLRERGEQVHETSLAALTELWEEAKAREKR